MNQVLQQRPTISINHEIRSMLRIYMVNLLTSEYGIESFTKQSIDCLTNYVCKNLVQLLIELKFMVNSQGKTIPNFLHLFLVWEINNMKLDNFLQYLKNKIRRQEQMKTLQIAKKYQTKKLIQKHNSMSSVEFPDKNYPNIYYIPQNYINIKHILEQPIPIKKPIDEYVDKPPFYSYCQDEVKTQTKLNEEAIKRQAISSEFQMKIMLQKQQKYKVNQNVYQNTSSQNKDKRINRQKISFDMCKYL